MRTSDAGGWLRRLVGWTIGFGAGPPIGTLAYELIPNKNVSG